MFVLAPSASLPVTVTAVHERCCEWGALHVVTQSLSSHLILTTTRVPRGQRRADQSQRAATVTKRPPLDSQIDVCVQIKTQRAQSWLTVPAHVYTSVWLRPCPFSIPLSPNAA